MSTTTKVFITCACINVGLFYINNPDTFTSHCEKVKKSIKSKIKKNESKS